MKSDVKSQMTIKEIIIKNVFEARKVIKSYSCPSFSKLVSFKTIANF